MSDQKTPGNLNNFPKKLKKERLKKVLQLRWSASANINNFQKFWWYYNAGGQAGKAMSMCRSLIYIFTISGYDCVICNWNVLLWLIKMQAFSLTLYSVQHTINDIQYY